MLATAWDLAPRLALKTRTMILADHIGNVTQNDNDNHELKIESHAPF